MSSDKRLFNGIGLLLMVIPFCPFALAQATEGSLFAKLDQFGQLAQLSNLLSFSADSTLSRRTDWQEVYAHRDLIKFVSSKETLAAIDAKLQDRWNDHRRNGDTVCLLSILAIVECVPPLPQKVARFPVAPKDAVNYLSRTPIDRAGNESDLAAADLIEPTPPSLENVLVVIAGLPNPRAAQSKAEVTFEFLVSSKTKIGRDSLNLTLVYQDHWRIEDNSLNRK